MAMTLGSMTNVAMLNRNYANAGTAADPVTQSLDIASKRVAAQIGSTDVQLSSYGQIKSGFSALQTSGKALTSLAKDASVGDVSKAAQSFVNAYNATAAAVGTAINGNGKSPGALANDNLVRVANNDLRRVTTSGTGSADLRKTGISVGQNGVLSVDTKALEAALLANPDAVKGALARLGQQAAATSTQELSSGGAVGSAVNALNSRAKNLATQQTQQLNLANSAQTAIQRNADLTANSASSSAGIGAYMKMLSL